jgi:hypothetical protein
MNDDNRIWIQLDKTTKELNMTSYPYDKASFDINNITIIEDDKVNECIQCGCLCNDEEKFDIIQPDGMGLLTCPMCGCGEFYVNPSRIDTNININSNPDLIYEHKASTFERSYSLDEVKILMNWARDKGDRDGDILYDEFLENALLKIDELNK